MSLLLFLGFETESAAPASAYARMMASLLPPGKLWRLVTDSVLSNVLLACGDELARLDARVLNLLDESDPTTANELIPEYERELDLDADGTFDERKARVVARYVARQRYRPVDFQTALAPLLGQLAEDVRVRETSHAEAVAMGDVREIFHFYIYRDPAAAGKYYLDSAQELVDRIKPSHTRGQLIESIAFIVGDPHSLVGRDLLGV
jgi:uncharacterized protein YmfQ (DUF2313 family)